MASKFPYRKASQCLAYAELFSKQSALKFYGVKRGTYDGWLIALRKDEKLEEMYEAAIKNLQDSWQPEVIKTLKQILNAISEGVANNPLKYVDGKEDSRLWNTSMRTLIEASKAVGDLTIATDVIKDDSD